jgi:hypothetical protein
MSTNEAVQKELLYFLDVLQEAAQVNAIYATLGFNQPSDWFNTDFRLAFKRQNHIRFWPVIQL